MDLVLRKGTELDISDILVILKEIVPLMLEQGNPQWNSEYPAFSDFQVDVNNGDLWVALFQGEIVGFCAITKEQGEDYAAAFDISKEAIVPHRLGVSIRARGKGVAKALLKQAEKIALDHSFQFVRIDTHRANTITNTLFPLLGYVYLKDITFAGETGTYCCYEKQIS